MKAGVIVQRALNLSGIIAKDLEEQDNEEGVEGLFWLNMVLAEKSASGVLLPYFGHIPVTAVVGQEIYFIPNLITAEVLTFTIDNVRYSVRGKNRNKYFGESRAENVESLPFQWYWERVNGGMNIYIYFTPYQAFEINVTGLLGLQDVSFETELNDFLDIFYQNLLIFETAEALCIAFQISLPPDTKMKLKRLRSQLLTINPRDFTIKKMSLTGNGGILTYAQVNFGRGWTA